jgi:hypothetical protein
MGNMPRNRRTRKQKKKPKNRPIQGKIFKVEAKEPNNINYKYFKADLTKTIILTMLALALELALWLYLSR